MKLIHISDIHINETAILDHDPVENFKLCMTHVENHHGDADMVVITGDLTHHGNLSSYQRLRELISGWRIEPLLMIGNHDDRDVFLEHFPEQATDRNGFVQYVIDREEGRFIFLDTVEPGTHAGSFCKLRQSWLEENLQEAEKLGVPVYLFMHHQPIDVGVKNSDIIGLMEGEGFRQILMRYNRTVRHLFFGHCHYVLSGSVCGIPMSAPRSTNHPCVPDFSDSDSLGVAPSPATYNVCLIGDESVIVHSIDFQLDDEILWYQSTADGWTNEKAV
ncbi:MAG: phosphodiesterase [Pseudomonadota bacterium]